MPRIFGPMVKPGVSFSTTRLAKPGSRPSAGLRAGQQGDAERHVGPCVGDERLAAVDQPAAVAPFGPGADPPCVGTGVGLGEPERAQRPPLGQGPQPALPLLVVPEEEERQRADGDVGLPGGGDGLVGVADLLHGGDEADVDMPIPPHSSGTSMPRRPSCAHFAEEIGRAAGLLPGQRRSGSDLALGEVTAEVDEVLFGLAEREVHGSPSAHRRAAGGPGRRSTSRGGRSARRSPSSSLISSQCAATSSMVGVRRDVARGGGDEDAGEPARRRPSYSSPLTGQASWARNATMGATRSGDIGDARRSLAASVAAWPGHAGHTPPVRSG